MNFEVVSSTKSPVPKKYLQKFLKKSFRAMVRKGVFAEGRRSDVLVLVFLSRGEAKKLNREFRKKDYATDVLSFEPIEPGYFGELILCPEVLKKQAKEHGQTYRDELCYMVLHGWLHLLGYEHERGGAAAKAMYALQDEIFELALK